MEIYENKELCKKCGGKCCKKCGCDYMPKDFSEFTTNAILEIIMKGDISVVAILSITVLENGKECLEPVLLLRARNKNRPIVDLLSFKTTCASLTESGCKYDYESRPSGGKNLIPEENGGCYQLEDPKVILNEWRRYQKILERIVKRITGKSVDECIKDDVYKLFLDCLYDNLDDVSYKEILEVRDLLPHLINIYPEEYKNAKNIYDNDVSRKRIK